MTAIIEWVETPAELAEFHRAGINRDSYPGEDSGQCVFGGCIMAARWRFLLGDITEHVARLCYCNAHAIFVAYARSHQCTACGQPMRIEVREKMDVPDQAHRR